MKQTIAKVYYDRKNQVPEKGVGAVEIYFRLSEDCVKYVQLGKATPEEWTKMKKSAEFKKKVHYYEGVVKSMIAREEDLTIENLNDALGIVSKDVKYFTFTDFVRDCIVEERVRESTKKHKYTTLEALMQFKQITYFHDLTPENLRAFDKWLKKDGTRSDVTCNTYHKNMKKFCRLAYEEGYLPENPYSKVHFPRGKSPERHPLNETELIKMRDYPLTGHFEKARDLFIFAAYTGLSYCDVEMFDYNTMTTEYEGIIYIDGSRMKTDTCFFTPIFQPAMDVLKKYRYRLPVISNQKVNDYLKVVSVLADIHKKVSFHIARHSFATLCLTKGVKIERLSRMLGHKDIKTTQIYAKILEKNIVDEANMMSALLR